ncbi:uncharacterized, partial [Tachysurus ichikawai]
TFSQLVDIVLRPPLLYENLIHLEKVMEVLRGTALRLEMVYPRKRKEGQINPVLTASYTRSLRGQSSFGYKAGFAVLSFGARYLKNKTEILATERQTGRHAGSSEDQTVLTFVRRSTS